MKTTKSLINKDLKVIQEQHFIFNRANWYIKGLQNY